MASRQRRRTHTVGLVVRGRVDPPTGANMSTDDSLKGPPALPSGRFTGRNDFQQLVRDALACAAREGWREIVLSDASFEDWPLGERAVAESLQAWSQSGRKCILLAHRWDSVVRMHARFVT